ncbi:MAG: aspartyl/glutamyl-tRNA amidotransferase subunit C [Patescibacteria group bacterium]|nr:aspartyl/glutamyl-tRNA amidotransferase subunit C [Patescibacteria group bacterium]
MISKEEVLKLAELARLKVSDAEVGQLQKDISSILDYVGQLAQQPGLTTTQRDSAGSSEEEASRAAKPHNVMRADTPRAAGDMLAGKEEALRAAFPTREGSYNVVRTIIQKDE